MLCTLHVGDSRRLASVVVGRAAAVVLCTAAKHAAEQLWHCQLAPLLWVLQAGRLILEECDVTSQSGVGVGVEGAAVTLANCSIHGCERHGVAVFGSLEGEGAASPTGWQRGRHNLSVSLPCCVPWQWSCRDSLACVVL
jgi:hypothetical protein